MISKDQPTPSGTTDPTEKPDESKNFIKQLVEAGDTARLN
jgi:hypothetical protein